MAKKSTEIKSLDINRVPEGIRRDCVSAIFCEEVFDTNLYPFTWLSGSSTEVYPITFWAQYIEVQLKNDELKDEFEKAVERVAKEYPDLFSNAYICENDGSCPMTARFVYTEETISKLKSSKR